MYPSDPSQPQPGFSGDVPPPGQPGWPGQPGYGPPPGQPFVPPATGVNKKVLILAAVLALAAILIGVLTIARAKSTSDEDQIRQTTRAFVQASNNADADRANALVCRQWSHPTTREDLQDDNDNSGTLDIVDIKDIEIHADHAEAVVLYTRSKKKPEKVRNDHLSYLREDGAWKICRPEH